MLRKLSLAFTFAFFTACATPETQSTISVQTEAPAVQLPTDFSVEPVVWETAGNSVQPGFMIADTATRNLVVTFEYVGSGEVQVPEGGTISAGENQVSYEGSFEAKPCSNDSGGTSRWLPVTRRPVWSYPRSPGPWSIARRSSVESSS